MQCFDFMLLHVFFFVFANIFCSIIGTCIVLHEYALCMLRHATLRAIIACARGRACNRAIRARCNLCLLVAFSVFDRIVAHERSVKALAGAHVKRFLACPAILIRAHFAY